MYDSKAIMLGYNILVAIGFNVMNLDQKTKMLLHLPKSGGSLVA